MLANILLNGYLLYKKGYFFEDGLVYYAESEEYDIYMIFTKE